MDNNKSEYLASWNKNLPLTFYNFVYTLANTQLFNNNAWIIHHFQLQSNNLELIKDHKNTTVYEIEHIDYKYIGSLFNKIIPESAIAWHGGNEAKASTIVDKNVGDLLYSEYHTIKPLTRNFYCGKVKTLFDNYYKADFDFLRAKGFNYELDII